MVTWGADEPISRGANGSLVNMDQASAANDANAYYENMIDSREPREEDEITPIRKVPTQDHLHGLDVSHKSSSYYDDPKHKYLLYPKIDSDIHKSINDMIVKKRVNY